MHSTSKFVASPLQFSVPGGTARNPKCHLRAKRSRALDAAVVLGAFAGVATCGATLVLFVGALRDTTLASLLFILFGIAILSTLGALIAFVVEMLMASRGLRAEVAQRRRLAEEDLDVPAIDAAGSDHVATPSP
jgi:ABC-type Fe3+-siderophore transport system permease subunit